MNSMQLYNKKRIKKNKRFIKRILFSSFFCLLLFTFVSKGQNSQMEKLKESQKELEINISNLNYELMSLKDDYKNRDSDSFKEKTAREKLNMIKGDELIYEDENNK